MRDVLTGEKLVARIERVSYAFWVLFTLGAWGYFSARMALGVFLGGAIAVTSFQVLKRQLRKALMTPGRVPQKGGVLASYYLRFFATLFFVFVVMYYGWANPIALLVGLSVIVISILLVGGIEILVLLVHKGEA